MKITLIKHLSGLALAAGFAGSTALAQLNATVNSAAQAAGGATGAISAGSLAGGSVGAGSAVGAGAQGAVDRAASLPAAPEAGVKAGVGIDAGVGAGAHAPGVSVAAEKSFTAGAALDMASTIHAINESAFESRKEVIARMDENLEATGDAIARIQKDARTLRGEAQANFRAAIDEAKAKEKAVHQSMKAAKKASADTWTEARSRLAADYSAYAQAVTNAEAAANAGLAGEAAGEAKK